jgi:predicted PolB exonuclease-like 3'-5' exonuclease
MPMIFRATDIETIPDLTVWGKHDQVTWKLVPGPRMLPDGQESAAVEEVESFPPPHAHRVVAISYVDILFDIDKSPRYQFLTCGTSCRWGLEDDLLDAEEALLLDDFNARMPQSTEAQTAIHLVTWNGRTFDLPVISLRSFKQKVACKWYYNNKDVRYRYSTEGHCDLMDFMSDFGAVRSMSLADACHLIGLPGKLDMTGASVHDLYRSTRLPGCVSAAKVQADVARYCLQDSIQTALLFLRSRYHIGKVTAETHNAALDTFSSSPLITDTIPLNWDRLRV